MSSIENILYEKTHKGDTHTVHERVFSTLTDIKGSEGIQTARAFSLLIDRLYRQKIINESDIDDLLLEVIF